MTSGKDDEEFFRQRGFGIKMGFGERPALIVIDMIKGFTDFDMPLGANLDTQIAAQTPLVEVAHERGIPVIFSTVVYEEEDVQRRRRLGAQAERLAHADRRLGSREGRSAPADKAEGHSARQEIRLLLFGTDLVPRLEECPAHRTLIITGCTPRAACAPRPSMPCKTVSARWWCASGGHRSVAAHDQSLFDLNAKYADVVSLDETLRVFLKRSATISRQARAG